MKLIDGFDISEGIDNETLTPEKQRVLDIFFRLDEAFRRDPSIATMNRAYRRVRTGNAETDRIIRDHIGMLYLLDRAKPALLRALRQGGKHREPVEMEVASS